MLFILVVFLVLFSSTSISIRALCQLVLKTKISMIIFFVCAGITMAKRSRRTWCAHVGGEKVFLPQQRVIQELVIEDMQKHIVKLTCWLVVIKLQSQVEELSCQLIAMKKRTLEDNDHKFMTSCENLFRRHNCNRQVLD